MTPVSETLKPCPFCGSKPVTERTGFSGRAMYIYCINDNGCPRPKAVGETEDKAIENWNLRFDFAQEAKDTLEVRQHIAWLFQYVQGMNERNWHDMKLRAERQLEQLSLALPGPSDSSTDREGK